MAKRKGILSKILKSSSKGRKTAARPKGSSRPKRLAQSSKGTKTSRPAAQKKQIKKPSTNKPTGEKEKFPHFRKYLKANHPALIVGEKSDTEYNYRKVMHSDRDGRHLNESVKPNPNPKDKKPMHIAKRVRHDEKTNFSKWKYPWEYPQK